MNARSSRKPPALRATLCAALGAALRAALGVALRATLGAALLALGAALLALGGAPCLAADPPAASADAAAIRHVVESQLAAFRRDDGAEAFGYAAPSIQQQFGTPEAFMRMVRQGYRPVYRPRQVIFEEVVQQDGTWVQPLLITAEDGRVLVALYQMERQPDDTWRISGVVLLKPKAQGA
jgi:Domain of unknown function (DUF4864)